MIEKQFFYDIVRQVANSEVIKSKNFIIAANWKMNKNSKEVGLFLDSAVKINWNNKNTVVLFPPSPYLYLMRDKLRYSKVLYGVQNIHWEDAGAFTGELSVNMAKDFGCKFAIIGHSERRNIFFETDEMMRKKVEKCVKDGIKPVLCIGENLNERNSGAYREKLKTQLSVGLEKVNQDMIGEIVIAYEPVWAIGTGVNATPDQVEDTHGFIRSVLDRLFGEKNSQKIPILYGGSVKPSNVTEIAVAQNVSGFLIGGASLKFDDMKEIIGLLE
jgi:triosephosphate isomerase (TIM)